MAAEQALHFGYDGKLLLKGGPATPNGIGLSLSFDPTDPVMVNQQELFLATGFAKLFTLNEWDGIPIYELDVGQDHELLLRLVPEILTAVFRENVETVGFDHHAV